MPGWRMGRSRCRSALMPFEMPFYRQALREWAKLSVGIREQFKNKLCGAGFRLIDQVRVQQVLVLVLAVGSDRQAGP